MIRREWDQLPQIRDHGGRDGHRIEIAGSAMNDAVTDSGERASTAVGIDAPEEFGCGRVSRLCVQCPAGQRHGFGLEREQRVLDARRSAIDGENGASGHEIGRSIPCGLTESRGRPWDHSDRIRTYTKTGTAVIFREKLRLSPFLCTRLAGYVV